MFDDMIVDDMIVDDGRLISIDDVFKNVNKLKDYIVTLKNQRDRALKELKEYNKDVEIQKLQDEIDELKNRKNKNLCFVITDDEQEDINNWIEEHTNEVHKGYLYAGAIGGNFSYQFVPTSLGDIGEIKCSCGEKYCFRELE